jgi:pyruvate/2-oxoglutarate dehydrogenase complex dihydrolipoamide dehydrogenase (E3) component
MKKFDLVVIGGGAAGLTAAKIARSLGKSVALIEKTNRLGGESTWTGSVPSKALVKSAQVAYQANHLEAYGLMSNAVDLSTENVMAHVRCTINHVYETHTPSMLEALGIAVKCGRAHLSDGHTLTINEETIHTNKMIIATGSSPVVPPLEGIETVPYLTNQTVYELKKIPGSMLILGGGPIGAEMASALNRLGCVVTIIEMASRILPKEDEELVSMLAAQMEKEGVRIRTNTKALRIRKTERGVLLSCIGDDDTGHEYEAETILIAVGRKPNVEGLGLDEAGVRTTHRGIIVDDMMRTTAKNIYAAGDVVGPYQFSHMAWYQAMVATRNAFIPFFKQRVSYDNGVWVTFTAPELATMGLTEHAARAQYGDSIKIYRKGYDRIDRAHIDGTQAGMAKIICDKRGYLLGAHILGERAGEMIHELALLKQAGKRFDYLHSMVHAYPTYSELIWHMANEAYVYRLRSSRLIRVCKKLFL